MARVKWRVDSIVLAADLAGTFIFAVQGADVALHGDLDLFGIIVVSFVAALGGGIVRDLLIGATPPNAIRDWRYPALTFFAGLMIFAWQPDMHGEVITTLDAAGLALFAVAGVEKALLYGIGPFAATLMGMVTAVGGGVIRDILLARVPLILRADIYATAALAGAAVVVAARRAGLPPAWAALAGGLACFVLRLVAVSQGWQLPTAARW